MYLVTRSKTSNPLEVSSLVQSAVWAIDGNLPVTQVKPLDTVLAESIWTPRLSTFVFSVFAAVALGLVLAGIYGVTTQTVSQRTPEIGVRLALGARSGSILALILRQGMQPVVVGVLIGLGLAMTLSRLIANQLYGVTAHDAVSLSGAVVLVVGSTLFTMLLPAFRATKVDPLMALRSE
jgi:putative ABC transport system permease protein